MILGAHLATLAQAWGLSGESGPARIVATLERQTADLVSRFAGHSELPRLVIHGDYYADNLLFDGDRIVGVLDYDEASWQPRVAELAEALIYFSSPRPGHLKQTFKLNPDKVPAFFDNWRVNNFSIF